MANDFKGTTWKIDTAGATSYWDYPAYIKRFRWIPNEASDVLTITDTLGHTIWTVTAITGAGAGDCEFPGPGKDLPYAGFRVTVMTAGTLYVTTE